MKKKKRLYCVHCGNTITRRDEDGILRDYCINCDVFFYDNPLPVVSTILPIDRSILLVKRKFRPYKGMWCLPSGFAEVDESIEDAAVRELEEETGVKGKIISLVDVDSCSNYFYGDLIFLTFEAVQIGGSLAPGSDIPSEKSPVLPSIQIQKLFGLLYRTSRTIGQLSIRSQRLLIRITRRAGKKIFFLTGLSTLSGKTKPLSLMAGSMKY